MKSRLELAWDLGYQRIVLEVNSKVGLCPKLYISKLSIWTSIRGGFLYWILDQSWSVGVRHFTQEGNTCADQLTNAAVRRSVGVHRFFY